MFDNLFDSVDEISPSKEYWFVRTDSGQHFETFYNNDFIGIGWNSITIHDLHKTSLSEVKDKIAKTEKLDPDIVKSKGKITAIYNKLKRFDDLKKGDLIIIPSRSSSRLAFGVIQDSSIYIENNPEDGCSYKKRKSVRWIESKTLSALDPIFYQIIVSRHAISNIKRYQNYIDNTTSSLYLKNNYGHIVFDIKTKKDINVDSLLSFMEAVRLLTKQISEDFGLDEDVSKSSIKLNLQSPGKIDYKVPKGKSLVLLAAILAISNGCNIDTHKLSPSDKKKLDTTATLHSDTISTIHHGMIDLEIDQEKINEIY